MFLSRFRRRKSVVQRIEEYTVNVPGPIDKTTVIEHITVNLPATVDGALLAHQIEHQLKRRGIA